MSAGPSWPPGNLAASCAVLSPTSRLKPATYTRAVTPGSDLAREIFALSFQFNYSCFLEHSRWL